MPDFDFPKGNLAPWWNYKALGMIKAGIGGFNLDRIKIDPIGNLTFSPGDKPLTIGKAAFAGDNHMKTVDLSNRVAQINKCAFAGCELLEEVYFGDKIDTIQARASSRPVANGDGVGAAPHVFHKFVGCAVNSSVCQYDD